MAVLGWWSDLSALLRQRTRSQPLTRALLRTYVGVVLLFAFRFVGGGHWSNFTPREAGTPSLRGTGGAPSTPGRMCLSQVCDAPQCSGLHAHYTGMVNERPTAFLRFLIGSDLEILANRVVIGDR
eukprot:TRINITY_DN781_c0_g2_i2.p3 TRINITY_DN781_c0_g2~~TRINITY_DN781_c0_g2_i2.p3  ORF type:complete len:125 (+),score=8.30 TRINITY_DN781_c0_g2_i2:49-423(+)